MDARRVISRLRELDQRSGGARVAWTDTWALERELLCDQLLDEVPGVAVDRDEAGNLWARLRGTGRETIAIGSHLDCVPGGGWLDGCLGVLAGAEVLRSLADDGPPAASVALVDWADEEGARFGHSLLGSSAACGLLDVEAAAELVDADGIRLPAALAHYGVELEAMPGARSWLEGVGAYVELHIEQGPVLDGEQRAASAVDGCLGVRRHELRFEGRAVHAGATPMRMRRDPVRAAAGFATRLRELALSADGLATIGTLRAEPGTPTAVPGLVRLSIDLRHRDLDALAALQRDALAAAADAAEEAGCSLAEQPLWEIDPIRFDPELVERATAATGGGDPLTSGPLHDAAAVAMAGIPTVMVFARTLGGVSHSREEDAREEDLVVAIDAFGEIVRGLAL